VFDWTVEPCLRVGMILAVSIMTEAGMLESVLAFRRMDVEVGGAVKADGLSFDDFSISRLLGEHLIGGVELRRSQVVIC